MRQNRKRASALSLAGALLCAVMGLVVACDGDDDTNAPGSGGTAGAAGSGGTGNAGGHGGTGGSAGKGGSSGTAGKGGAAGKGGGNAGLGGANAGQAGGGAGGVSGNTEAGNAGGGVGGATESGCEPVLVNGSDTGVDKCTDGTYRRRAARRCMLPATTASANNCATCTGSGCCEADSDCTPQADRGPVAMCGKAHELEGFCGCYSGCREDADCGAGSVCLCGAVFGQCVPATCRSNGDCGQGLHCVEGSIGVLGGGAGAGDGGEGGRSPCVPFRGDPTFTCETPNDTCKSDLDCGNDYCEAIDGKHECIRECPI